MAPLSPFREASRLLYRQEQLTSVLPVCHKAIKIYKLDIFTVRDKRPLAGCGSSTSYQEAKMGNSFSDWQPRAEQWQTSSSGAHFPGESCITINLVQQKNITRLVTKINSLPATDVSCQRLVMDLGVLLKGAVTVVIKRTFHNLELFRYTLPPADPEQPGNVHQGKRPRDLHMCCAECSSDVYERDGLSRSEKRVERVVSDLTLCQVKNGEEKITNHYVK
ncbi:hypothetical protein O3P69_004455 [Scylla paramamosain]|uniref:Uncharacterized protein n=1 Tax=Scylla paramamosain TaxID=85552 RepID=A0AAW0UC87_SCYPA